MAIDLGVVLTLLLVVRFFAQWLACRMQLPTILLHAGVADADRAGCFTNRTSLQSSLIDWRQRRSRVAGR